MPIIGLIIFLNVLISNNKKVHYLSKKKKQKSTLRKSVETMHRILRIAKDIKNQEYDRVST